MELLCNKILKGISRRNVLSSEQEEILAFGIQSALEISVNVAASMALLLIMDRMMEGLFFFIVFIPLRMHSGGYHSDTYVKCFIVSLVTLLLIMLFSDRINLPVGIGLGIIIALETLIGITAPVLNPERPVSKREYGRFTAKLKKILYVIAAAAVVLTIFQMKTLLNVLMLTLMLVYVSLVIGKIKYKGCQEPY